MKKQCLTNFISQTLIEVFLFELNNIKKILIIKLIIHSFLLEYCIFKISTIDYIITPLNCQNKHVFLHNLHHKLNYGVQGKEII